MPKNGNGSGELTDEDLELVVGGSKDMKHLFGHWRGYIKEGVDLKVGTFFEHPHQNLNKSLWDENDQLKPEVKERLLEIAQQFISKTQGSEANIKDIILTGSLANYNYSILSDIDLHLLLDFSELNSDEEALVPTVVPNLLTVGLVVKLKSFFPILREYSLEFIKVVELNSIV